MSAEQPGEARERLRRVEALYHEMLARPAHEREAALAAACPNDPALAAEVQSLLDQPESAFALLATPVMEVAADLVSTTGTSLTGRRIGVFEVQELLGVGGMGEVYRGRDTRLGRAVAIKVLPRVFASDPDRLTRFNREARVLASLNHPNIGTLYGVEEDGGAIALVLEFVEGETLGRRIAGQRLPVPEALSVARQIADALDTAHERGVVHRDLKPANIMITANGAVKVLDFGLARLGQSGTAAPDLSRSPTATSGGTVEGAILGTTAYMSPEQARGLPVDRRTDIWAFGCVLYEMLTGCPAFARDTTSDTIAAIIEREADWAQLPKGTPDALTRLLRRCLEKDPRRRLRDIADARAELEGAEPATALAEGGGKSRMGEWPRWKTAALVASGLALVATAFGAWAWLRGNGRNGARSAEPIAFDVALPAGVRLFGAPVLSNDGRQIAFAGQHGATATRGIYLRELATPKTRLLEGTAGGTHPFFSPTGDRLAFFASGNLKVTKLDGGAPWVLCPAPDWRGGTWGEDDVIIFGGLQSGLSRVPGSGGPAEPLTTLAPGEISHRSPLSMPGSSGLVFVAMLADGRNAIMAMARADKTYRRLVERAMAPRYAEGFLFYVNDREEFMAAPFDANTLTLRGPGVPQPERFSLGSNVYDFAYGVSRSGTLVSSPFSAAERSLVMIEPGGRQHPIPGPARPFEAPRASPDGEKIAVTISQGAWGGNVWVGDRSGSFLPLTRDGLSRNPVWNARSDAVAVQSWGSLGSSIFEYSIDGRQARLLVPSSAKQPNLAPLSWPSDSTLVIVASLIPGRRQVSELQWVGLPKTVPERIPLAVSASGRVSPDGRWLAYTTRESGQSEIYLTDFPGARRIWPVSKAGSGREPVWAKAGRELFFLRADGSVMTTSIGPGGQPSEPRSAGVGKFPVSPGGVGNPWWDTLPGGRFIVTRTITSPEADSIAVVVNRTTRLASR